MLIGARDFVSTGSGIRFHFRGSSKANLCEVTLDTDSDTYIVKLYKQSRSGLDTALFYEASPVYADNLATVFEQATGLYLSIGSV